MLWCDADSLASKETRMFLKKIRTLTRLIIYTAASVLAVDNTLYYFTQQPGRSTAAKLYAANGELVLNGGAMDTNLIQALAPEATVRITSTEGGSYRAMQALSNHDVIIDGECTSACTWLFVTSNRACFTPTAQFNFHAWHIYYRVPYVRSSQLRKLLTYTWRNYELTQLFIRQVREPIQQQIQGLLQTSAALSVPTKEFIRTYPDRLCA